MKLHILGICGTFMGGVAALAREHGHVVEGSDPVSYTHLDVYKRQILDGYPRNLAQADALGQLLGRIGQQIEHAVQLDVDTELLVERIAGRAREQGRQDDTPEAVRNRLAVYNDVTAPVVDFYRQRGLLKVVDGEGSMDDVFNRIVEAISVGVDVG